MRDNKKLWGILLAIGASLNEAALSFIGMLTLLQGHRIPGRSIIAASSGIFAISIEGEVFCQNMIEGLQYAFSKNGLKHTVARNLIFEYIENEENKNELLEEYLKSYLQLKLLTRSHHHENIENMDVLRSRVYLMEEILIEHLERGLYQTIAGTQKNKFLEQYGKKYRFMMLAHVINFIALPGAFISSFYAAYQLLFFFGVAASVCTGIGIPIAILATAAYALMIYTTMAQIIHDDMFKKYKNQLMHSFKKGNFCKKTKIVVAGVLFITLLVFLTLATAGTWWHTGVGGQAILFHLSGLIASIIVGVFSGLYTLTTFIFNFKNMSETIDELSNISFKNLLCNYFIGLAEAFTSPFQEFIGDKESVFQKSNFAVKCVLVLTLIIPLAITLQVLTNVLYKLWTVVAFTGHCISEGATTDQAFFIPATSAIVAGTVIEGLSDCHYISNEGDGSLLEMNQSASTVAKIRQLNKTNAGHSHSNVPGKVFCFIFSVVPLLFINKLFFYLLSNKDKKYRDNYTFNKMWSVGHHGHDHNHDHHHEHEHHHNHDTKPQINKLSSIWKCEIVKNEIKQNQNKFFDNQSSRKICKKARQDFVCPSAGLLSGAR